MTGFILFVVVLGSANIWATRRLLATDEFGFRKGLAVGMVWAVPFIGIFLAKELVPWAPPAAQPMPAAQKRIRAETPAQLVLGGAELFCVEDHMRWVNEVPLLDWEALGGWAGSFADLPTRTHAIQLGRRAWLLHLRDAFGANFHLHESEHALILSSLEDSVAVAMAHHVEATRRRITKVLDGLAKFSSEEKSILLLVDDEETYYHYVATYYPDEGEFAFSGGMFINAGCPHFVARRMDLQAIEAVIVHEMTHSSVAHLKLPLWLDEGIAVNTEHRLAGAQPKLQTPQELRAMHLKFWEEETIQEFWAGTSFQRTDDGNLLSYELARILVDYMSREWQAFAQFASNASREDGGAAAALQYMSMDLGQAVCALLEQPVDEAWAPSLLQRN
ncbi:MAG TPA: hypothetical protein VLJ57_09355 [Burkholderiaceae bacterium]|nr:hypothetical protein [Burkholderiaceae bacterium]